VIAISLVCNDILQLIRLPDESVGYRDKHVFSLYCLLPFIGCTAALLRYNWYPSRVFVGDAFCYFAGMTLAVSSIMGHYSKTLLLFMLPQGLNFAYSIPQLARWIPCPRHRLPGYDVHRDVSTCSYVRVNLKELPRMGVLTFKLVNTLKLCRVVKVSTENESDDVYDVSNFTLINFVLHVFGDMHERRLVVVLMWVQVAFSGFAFLCRYQFSGMFYQSIL